MLRVGVPILGFTPVCTVAKELAVALASNHLTKAENIQAHSFTATEASCLIIRSQCYIRKVRAESVCLLLISGCSLIVAPSPQVQDGKMRNWFRVDLRKVLPFELITIQGNGIGGSCCCCDYIVLRNDIRDPLCHNEKVVL